MVGNPSPEQRAAAGMAPVVQTAAAAAPEGDVTGGTDTTGETDAETTADGAGS